MGSGPGCFGKAHTAHTPRRDSFLELENGSVAHEVKRD
jgi:hypothetical protein